MIRSMRSDVGFNVAEFFPTMTAKSFQFAGFLHFANVARRIAPEVPVIRSGRLRSACQLVG